MNSVAIIEDAFSHRSMPKLFLLPDELAKHEVDDVMAFWGKPWSRVTARQLEKHFEAIYWFTPEAFCYYLPGIVIASIKEEQPYLIVNRSIVNMLDRSPDPASWDNFFLARWPLLTVSECAAVQGWLLWLASFENGAYSDNALSRSFDTLELLKARA